MFDILRQVINATPSGINGSWTSYDNAIVCAALALIILLFVMLIDKIFGFLTNFFRKGV